MRGKRAIPENNMMWQVLDSVENRRTGVLESQQYRRKMCRLLGRQLRATETRTFADFIAAEDADVRGDRIAVVSAFQTAQYEVVHRAGDREHEYARLFEQTFPRSPRRQRFSRPLAPCVRWSPAGAMYTTSGTVRDSNAVQVLDEVTSTVVETVECAPHGASGVFTHEHSRLNPALIGIGTDLSKVLIADLRTGNMTVSSGTKHTSGVCGIAWSFSDEHQLVSACANETFIWDVRWFAKKPLLQLPRHASGRFVSPDIKFLDANRVLIMSDNQQLQVFNVGTGSLVDSIRVDYKTKNPNGRYKFALNRDANAVFYAVKRSVRRYNLNSKKIEMEATGGHVWPIEMLLFNDYTIELYTMNSNLEAIVWTPFR